MLLPTHREFGGRELDLECVASSLRQQGLIFGRQMSYEKLNIFGDDDVQQAASTFVEGMEELELKRRKAVWEKPNIFSGIQTYSVQNLYAISMYHMKDALYGQA